MGSKMIGKKGPSTSSKKNTSDMLVSVLMPVFNEEQFLSESIESILAQTYRNFELIIVDDGSTDATPKILQKYARKDHRIKIITIKKSGLAYALNTALKQAKGFYIARMDADDISFPQRFEKQVAYLQKHPHIIAIGAQAELIDEYGQSLGLKSFPSQPKILYALMCITMPIQHPLLMTYASIMKKCTYENHSTAEDVSMFFQLLTYGDFSNVPQVLLHYRIRPQSNSLKDPKKTFLLTLKSRIKGIREYGYKPSIYGILVNIAQACVVFLLPNAIILSLYQMWRFKKNASPQYLVQKMVAHLQA